ncbi:YbaK/EbsC family protein [Sulfurospirillum sp. 1612]|uniref:YbaK/EbsC family protein n=1 Tax=Sulfurospirillum sp. 1612 TaxID=3094835 RepID=UPI002F91DDFF
MGIEQARAHLQGWNKEKDIIEFDVSSATVELAAKALGTEESRIAKSLSFMLNDRAILVVTSGEVKIDNKKYKQEFGTKAKMLSFDQVGTLIGHDVGGVCPFGVNEDVDIYLDVSLKQYDFIYPACGSSNSAIKLTHDQLYEISGALRWVDVCKLK